LDLAFPVPAWRLELGPAHCSFEIPSRTLSGLHIRFLRLSGPPGPPPAQSWVRYLSHSQSYVLRL
ncbi:AP4M1 protein, partial [Erpornis zantholeuca]|nr:AP4M1 protein [Erpornis zantholeuca]